MLIALNVRPKDIPLTASSANRRENGQNPKSVQSAMAQENLSRTINVDNVTVSESRNLSIVLVVMGRDIYV